MMIAFMDVSVVSWKIWGAKNRKAQRHIMELINEHQPMILIIMETHEVYDKTKSFWDRAGYKRISVVEVQGQSGGLWLSQQNGSTLNTTIIIFMLML